MFINHHSILDRRLHNVQRRMTLHAYLKQTPYSIIVYDDKLYELNPSCHQHVIVSTVSLMNSQFTILIEAVGKSCDDVSNMHFVLNIYSKTPIDFYFNLCTIMFFSCIFLSIILYQEVPTKRFTIFILLWIFYHFHIKIDCCIQFGKF